MGEIKKDIYTLVYLQENMDIIGRFINRLKDTGYLNETVNYDYLIEPLEIIINRLALVENENNIKDKMIDLLCKLLEKYGGSVDEICNEVATDECTLECETCIKDIVRKKVGGN